MSGHLRKLSGLKFSDSDSVVRLKIRDKYRPLSDTVNSSRDIASSQLQEVM